MIKYLKILLFLLIITVPLSADIRQEGTVLVLSTKVGSDIDSLENVYYGIFPQVRNFHKAWFLYQDSTKVRCEIEYWGNPGHLVHRSIILSDRSFMEKKTDIGLIPAMPANWGEISSAEIARKENAELLMAIPGGSELLIRTYDRGRYKGQVRTNEANELKVRETLLSHRIPYDTIKSCTILEDRELTPELDLRIRLTLSAVAGGGIWYLSPSLATDRRLYRSFTFSVATYFISKPLIRSVIGRFPRKTRVKLKNTRS